MAHLFASDERLLLPVRVRRALERRSMLVENPRFCRVVNGAGDELPGVSVDRFDGHYVVRSASPCPPELAWALVEMGGAQSVLERGPFARALHGSPPRWTRVLERGARLTVDLHRPDYPYEHRPVRRLLSRLSPGARVLDVRCRVGGLLVHAALHGAKSVLAFDPDSTSVELARENAAANGVAARVHVEAAAPLRALQAVSDPFDLVLLDAVHVDSPGAFAELLGLAVRRVRREGRLLVLAYDGLGASLFEAVARVCSGEGRSARVLAQPGLPFDFPLPLPAEPPLRIAVLELC